MAETSQSATLEAGTPSLVVPLEQLGRDDIAIAGGKGANLGELINGGFPVPAGFVITTASYDRFVAEGGLAETIALSLREIETGGAEIRSAFQAASIPAEVERAILAAYRELGQGSVAVRSSATAEDLPGAAFAGQQDTFLNVIGEGPLLDAVRRCWASLWTHRAISYRGRQGIDQSAVKLAVVVQRMLLAESAGVMFTANPVTGARNEIVVDASPGLGEAVVSGLVTPDHYLLSKDRLGWKIQERRLGEREVVIRAVTGGGTEHMKGSALAVTPTLDDLAMHRLAHLGERIERHFGAPQDVEWARAGGKIFVVQSRPITALPEPAPESSFEMRMLAGILTEILPARPYPLEYTTWGPDLLVTALLGPMIRLVGLDYHLDRSVVEEDGVLVRFNGRFPVHPTPRVLLAPVRLLRQALRYDPARWSADPLLAEARSRVRALEARDPAALSWAELLVAVHEILAVPGLIGELRVRYLPRAGLAMGAIRLLLELLGAGNRFGTLLFTGVESTTMEANRALEALAARVRTDPTLAGVFEGRVAGELRAALEELPSGRAFLADLYAFLDDYGHREVGGTLQVSQSTWKDVPEAALGIIKGLASAPLRSMARRPAWETVRDEVLAHPLLRILPLRSAFLWLLAEARWFPSIREDTRFYGTLILPALHRTLVEFGRRLTSADILDDPRDVFHLRLEELERIDGTWPPAAGLAGELRSLVALRKEKRAALESTHLLDPRLLRPATPEGDLLVSGTPGSPGVAEGPVRVVRDASDFGKLLPGEVLVAPYTSPAWTPLFQRAAAVVVNSGGLGSHAAIVAREYGIPAVMGTVDGTSQLLDGQRVRVDGNRGVVVWLEHQPWEPAG